MLIKIAKVMARTTMAESMVGLTGLTLRITGEAMRTDGLAIVRATGLAIRTARLIKWYTDLLTLTGYSCME